jgi:cysteine desulfurase/selenocysteine lyase
MSTSDVDGTQLIDVEVLTRLANQFFSAVPGAEPGAIAPDLLAKSGHHPSGVTNIRQPQTSLPDPHGLVAEEKVPAVPNHLPHSEAGVGTSLSAAPKNTGRINEFGKVANVAPQEAPDSVLGFNPLARSLPSHDGMPNLDAMPFDTELQSILSRLHSPMDTSMPAMPTASAPQYYFMEHARGFPGTAAVSGASTNPVVAGKAAAPFDIELVRRDFPILQERVNGRQLVWLDNAATTQKPNSVIERVKYFYEHENSNIHRAAHELAARATDAYEGAREKVRSFLNARSVNECVFVRGTTEAINLVAQSWGRTNIGAGDEIIVSWLEHHANIVPWFRLCEERGAKLRVIPVDDDGQILIDEYAKLLNPRTKLVAFTQVSNALGTITPAKQMIEMAHSAGATVLLDGAQSVSHMRVDMQQLNPDFFVFSGHKVFGPTGIGVLYGREALLNDMPPWQGGGNMIKDVTFENIQYHRAPGRFEAAPEISLTR